LVKLGSLLAHLFFDLFDFVRLYFDDLVLHLYVFLFLFHNVSDEKLSIAQFADDSALLLSSCLRVDLTSRQDPGFLSALLTSTFAAELAEYHLLAVRELVVAGNASFELFFDRVRLRKEKDPLRRNELELLPVNVEVPRAFN